jgi:hypothetical protein
MLDDAQVLSKWGAQTVDANPDMAKARRRVKSLDPQWRFCFSTAVEFDPATDSVIVADSQRYRLQIYKKVRDDERRRRRTRKARTLGDGNAGHAR